MVQESLISSETFQGFGVIALIVSLIWGILKILKILKKFVGRFLPEYPVKREVELNREIYTALVELRAVADADRAYVFRFHNGIEFLPSHPAWKLSCTHEVVRPGVSYESGKIQGLLVSLIPNIVGAVMTGSTSASGIAVSACKSCDYQIKCLKENKRVIVIKVGDLENNYSKYWLESQNIKTAVFCGIAQNGNVYGMVGLDFCSTEISPENIADISLRICRATDRIQYLLRYKKNNTCDLPLPETPVIQ